MPMGVFHSYRRNELMVDNFIHVIGVAAGLIGTVILFVAVAYQKDVMRAFGVVLYGFGLISMLAASALYNMAQSSDRRALFQRMDHAAIFVMIAGTHTPFALLALNGPVAYGFFALVWGVALMGAGLKLWAPHLLSSPVSTALYLLLGWGEFVTLAPVFGLLSTQALSLLVAGGVLYSLGVAFHHWHRLPFHNAIWHGMVLAAAACHYGAILEAVVLA